MNAYEWTTTLLVPITGVVSWLAATRLRQNATIREMQQTIFNLVEENKRVYSELTEAGGKSSGFRPRSRNSLWKTPNSNA